MDFYSAYHQGFVRVAACTHHTTLADPAANAESVLRMARACHDDSVALAVFPELTLSGYSIEDILLQDALLDAVEDAVLDVVVASAELMPVLVVGAPLRYAHRIYNTAVVIHRGRVLGVVPKSYLPTYREFYEKRQMAAGDDVRGAIRMGDADVPFGPDLLFTATDLTGLCCTSRSARTCSSPCRRAQRPLWRGRRFWPTCPAARSPSGAPRIAACWLARRRRAAWPPMSTPRRGRASPPPIWRGTARPWCGRTACVWLNPNGSPRASDARSPTWIWSCCARSGCAWARSTTTAVTTGSPRSRSGGWSSTRPAIRRHRFTTRGRAVPVRAGG